MKRVEPGLRLNVLWSEPIMVLCILQAILCIKVLIMCASNPSNLPVFNSSFSQSDIIISILPLTHGQCSDLALHCKVLLALLDPLLDCNQLSALKLNRSEANACVSLLSRAVIAPDHVWQDLTLLTLLRAVIWFSHEHHNQDPKLMSRDCSQYEEKLVLISSELKANIQLLVEEGVLSVIEDALKLNNQDVRVTAVRLLWCLVHSPNIKLKVKQDAAIVKALQAIHSCLPTELSVATHCALWILEQGI